MAFTKETISQLNYDEVYNIYQDPNATAILIDVREREEYEEGHIPGIPLLPMSEIIEVIGDFHKEQEYILVCRSGRRSHEVAKFFKDQGIEQVHNFSEGMLGWQADKTKGEEWIVKEVNELYK
ncbi:rhodanese-like domain-containing protein [Texcoconibacillus texcoconensis]|uniref:Rhodanese-related sulfurtransferase n=1 Tax=Texcoconibacillus texcoconensis TaxID=1095777 RepID=A0A840QHS7_9BACI|nr:rhodanese-like domain-containing protein [Texcoconibacillus texcoconensis]MBB5171884.1 rhodanese-related sulfurtransferase [Texcoconibacillus texcoconensis]